MPPSNRMHIDVPLHLVRPPPSQQTRGPGLGLMQPLLGLMQPVLGLMQPVGLMQPLGLMQPVGLMQPD